jgi:dihydrofolate reductase
MTINLIAAMSENRVIGNKGRLPWGHLPADLANLYRVTANCPMIMGRKSYESADRVWSTVGNVVVTRQENYVLDEGFVRAENLEKALDILRGGFSTDIFILGGGEIFQQAILLADFIHLTVVHGIYEGDAFFPKIPPSVFERVSEIFHPSDAENLVDFSFQVYKKTFKNA